MKTKVDPCVAAQLYQSGMKLEDLQRLQGEIEWTNHMGQHLGLSVDAQAHMMQAFNSYQQAFAQEYKLSPQAVSELAHSNPNLFAQYEQLKWDASANWFLQAGPPTITLEQQMVAVNYFLTKKDHLQQSTQDAIAKAQGKK